MKSKISFILLILVSSFMLSCDAIDDLSEDAMFIVECDIDGVFHRAQGNDEAFMFTSLVNPNSYTVTGQDIPKDFHIDLYLFRELGEGKISVNTKVAGNLLTSIGLFENGKSYSATSKGGEGCVQVDVLTDDTCEGSFEGIVVELRDEVEKKVITNGVFKVKKKR